jgi:FeS assembly SUF system protein
MENEEKTKNEQGNKPGEESPASGTAEQEWKYPPNVVKEEVVKVLKTCFDPEIPVDVYELGLVYDILVAANGDVLVVMTLTSPSCPVAGTLPTEIEEKIKAHPMVHDAKVQITFDPPWDMGMMSEEARLELGFL